VQRVAAGGGNVDDDATRREYDRADRLADQIVDAAEGRGGDAQSRNGHGLRRAPPGGRDEVDAEIASTSSSAYSVSVDSETRTIIYTQFTFLAYNRTWPGFFHDAADSG
jgi:hypothetical protein